MPPGSLICDVPPKVLIPEKVALPLDLIVAAVPTLISLRKLTPLRKVAIPTTDTPVPTFT